MIDSTQIRELIEETLMLVNAKMATPEGVEIVNNTAIAESMFRYIKQIGKGPALSFWQIEPNTAYDISDNYISYRDSLQRRMDRLFGEDWEDRIEGLLRGDMRFAIIMCRLQYWRQPDILPAVDDIEGQARLWKKLYNTKFGKGTVEHFIVAVDEYRGLV